MSTNLDHYAAPENLLAIRQPRKIGRLHEGASAVNDALPSDYRGRMSVSAHSMRSTSSRITRIAC